MHAVPHAVYSMPSSYLPWVTLTRACRHILCSSLFLNRQVPQTTLFARHNALNSNWVGKSRRLMPDGFQLGPDGREARGITLTQDPTTHCFANI